MSLFEHTLYGIILLLFFTGDVHRAHRQISRWVINNQTSNGETETGYLMGASRQTDHYGRFGREQMSHSVSDKDENICTQFEHPNVHICLVRFRIFRHHFCFQYFRDQCVFAKHRRKGFVYIFTAL